MTSLKDDSCCRFGDVSSLSSVFGLHTKWPSPAPLVVNNNFDLDSVGMQFLALTFQFISQSVSKRNSQFICLMRLHLEQLAFLVL